MGAAFVALLLIAGQPGFQARIATELPPGDSPLMLSGLGFQLSVTSETRAGETPILPEADPQAFVAEILIPRLGLELRRPTFTFQLFYTPRFYWQDPNPDVALDTELLPPDRLTRIRGQVRSTSSRLAPLILHTLGLSLDSHPSQRVSVTGAATGSIGSPDYTALPQLLGTVQAALPPIVSLASADGDVTGRLKLTRRWELALGGHASFWHWLNAPASTAVDSTANGQTVVLGQPLVTGQTSVSLTPEARYLVTPDNSLALSTAVGAVWYSDGDGISTVTPAVTWRTRITQLTELRLTGGLTYAHTLGTTPPGALPLLGASGSAVAPIGSFELYSHVMRSGQIMVQSLVAGDVDFYVDPVLGTAVSRATAGAGVIVIAAPRWMASLRGDFGTALRRTPYSTVLDGVPVPGAIPPDETAFSVSLSVRRWISEAFLAEVGGRWADRGPALVTPDFAFHQRQLWVYLALTATTRPIARLAH